MPRNDAIGGVDDDHFIYALELLLTVSQPFGILLEGYPSWHLFNLKDMGQ